MFLCMAVLVVGAATSVPVSSSHASSSHVSDLAIKRSMPNGRTDVIKAM
jgi:hypothetical protein